MVKEQIEEMRKEVASIHRFFMEDDDYEDLDDYIADELYNAGYRKIIHCKDCAYRDTEGCPNTYWNGGELESNVEDDDFCGGAKMKGGAE